MTNTKFTPGPWNNEKPNGGETLARVWHVREGIIRTLHIQSPLFRGRVGEGEANAHLIAAAPELYAALIEAKLQIEYLHEKFAETGSGNNMLAKIDAALAKARGEWSADDILKREG